MHHGIKASLAIVAILLATPALCVPVTWHMSGEVTTGNAGDFFFPFQANAGDPVSFDFSFEPQTPCVTCGANTRVYDNPLTSFSLTVRDKQFTMPLASTSITLRNDSSALPGGLVVDGLSFDVAGTSPSGIYFFGDLVVQNTGSTAPVSGIDNVELMNLTPPDPALFRDPSLSFFNFGASFDGGFDSFGGRFVAEPVVSTPEPSVLALFAASIAFVWLVRRQPRHSRPENATRRGASM